MSVRSIVVLLAVAAAGCSSRRVATPEELDEVITLRLQAQATGVDLVRALTKLREISPVREMGVMVQRIEDMQIVETRYITLPLGAPEEIRERFFPGPDFRIRGAVTVGGVNVSFCTGGTVCVHPIGRAPERPEAFMAEARQVLGRLGIDDYAWEIGARGPGLTLERIAAHMNGIAWVKEVEWRRGEGSVELRRFPLDELKTLKTHGGLLAEEQEVRVFVYESGIGTPAMTYTTTNVMLAQICWDNLQMNRAFDASRRLSE